MTGVSRLLPRPRDVRDREWDARDMRDRGRVRQTGAGPICALGVKLFIVATRLTVIARCESEVDVTLVSLRGTGKMDAWTQAGCLTKPTDNSHGRG